MITLNMNNNINYTFNIINILIKNLPIKIVLKTKKQQC